MKHVKPEMEFCTKQRQHQNYMISESCQPVNRIVHLKMLFCGIVHLKKKEKKKATIENVVSNTPPQLLPAMRASFQRFIYERQEAASHNVVFRVKLLTV